MYIVGRIKESQYMSIRHNPGTLLAQIFQNFSAPPCLGAGHQLLLL